MCPIAILVYKPPRKEMPMCALRYHIENKDHLNSCSSLNRGTQQFHERLINKRRGSKYFGLHFVIFSTNLQYSYLLMSYHKATNQR